mmetsp:Transcript_5962/g.23139  ORF Transcript_5962/g.23139 Transcript_5962/m.23139 type:complete len:207 (-) Transcript_5962:2050-2670(-)
MGGRPGADTPPAPGSAGAADGSDSAAGQRECPQCGAVERDEAEPAAACSRVRRCARELRRLDYDGSAAAEHLAAAATDPRATCSAEKSPRRRGLQHGKSGRPGGARFRKWSDGHHERRMGPPRVSLGRGHPAAAEVSAAIPRSGGAHGAAVGAVALGVLVSPSGWLQRESLHDAGRLPPERPGTDSKPLSAPRRRGKLGIRRVQHG